MLEATYNDWTLVSLSPWPLGWRMVAFVIVVVAMSAVLWSYLSARRRFLLMALRMCGALLVIGFVTEPALQLRVVRKIRNRLAVIIDRSASMTLKAADGRTRYEQVLDRLGSEEGSLARLSESHVVELFDLEDPLTTGQLATPPKGERTDLLLGLERARDAGTGRPLAGVVLFSDGADNANLEGSQRGTLAESARQRLSRLDVPVNTVGVANADGYKDIAIIDVRTDEFAFVHNTWQVEVRIESTGFNSLTLPVTLRREAAVIATQEVATRSGDSTIVRFATKPDQIGSFVYTVSVPQFSGEAITSNNQRSFVVQVIRDKIRVLQVAGRPSWDERFLRQHLKENPNVDLISFFILRAPTDVPVAPEEELSLIPFPVDELFTTELSSFDVVILQNFDYRPYNMAQYLPNIQSAVLERGLGFVMIGGDQSFATGSYVGTAIEEIVPLRVDAGDVYAGPVSPRLTEAGRRHPITDLARHFGSNERVWTGLPGWTSLNRTAGLLPGATCLVTDRQVRGLDGELAPLVAVMDAGQGRAMAVATDSMWRWRFAAHQDGGTAQRAYHRFWSNALHWLVRDPEHSRVQVLPAKRRFELGEPVEVTLVVRGRDYQPVPFAQTRISVEHTGVGTLEVDDVVTGEAGVARQRYEELPPGAFRVSASASAGGEDLGQGTGVLLVEARSVELSRAAPRPDLLAAIARATGGQDVALESGVWEAIEVVDPEVVEVDRRRNIELWDNAWALLAAIVLLACEWAMRRRSGYL